MTRRPNIAASRGRLHVHLDLGPSPRLLGTRACERNERRAYFEYAAAFLAAPLPVAPIRLPTRPGATPAPHHPTPTP